MGANYCRSSSRIPISNAFQWWFCPPSKAEEDIFKSYDLHANCFITKPVDLEQFIELVKSVEEFWFTVVMLPERRRR